MAAITDKPMSEKDDAEVAILRERTPIEGDGQHSLIELEWQKRLFKVQHDFNEALMLKQHELNKEIVKKQMSLTKASIIFTLVGVILGAILTTYLPKLLPDRLPVQKTSSEQSSQPTAETETAKPDVQQETGLPVTKGTDDSISLKAPPMRQKWAISLTTAWTE